MNIKRKIFAVVCLLLSSNAVHAAWECIGPAKITELHANSNWLHIALEGVTNADIKSCGVNSHKGILLNFNDAGVSADAKKLMHSMLISAYMANKPVRLCADACDSQHPTYSRLVAVQYIN